MASPDATLVDAVLSKTAPGDRQLSTTMWCENDQIRVWEVILQPGERRASLRSRTRTTPHCGSRSSSYWADNTA